MKKVALSLFVFALLSTMAFAKPSIFFTGYVGGGLKVLVKNIDKITDEKVTDNNTMSWWDKRGTAMDFKVSISEEDFGAVVRVRSKKNMGTTYDGPTTVSTPFDLRYCFVWYQFFDAQLVTKMGKIDTNYEVQNSYIGGWNFQNGVSVQYKPEFVPGLELAAFLPTTNDSDGKLYNLNSSTFNMGMAIQYTNDFGYARATYRPNSNVNSKLNVYTVGFYQTGGIDNCLIDLEAASLTSGDPLDRFYALFKVNQDFYIDGIGDRKLDLNLLYFTLQAAKIAGQLDDKIIFFYDINPTIYYPIGDLNIGINFDYIGDTRKNTSTAKYNALWSIGTTVDWGKNFHGVHFEVNYGTNAASNSGTQPLPIIKDVYAPIGGSDAETPATGLNATLLYKFTF